MDRSLIPTHVPSCPGPLWTLDSSNRSWRPGQREQRGVDIQPPMSTCDLVTNAGVWLWSDDCSGSGAAPSVSLPVCVLDAVEHVDLEEVCALVLALARSIGCRDRWLVCLGCSTERATVRRAQ